MLISHVPLFAFTKDAMKFTKHEDKFSNFSYTVMLSKAR